MRVARLPKIVLALLLCTPDAWTQTNFGSISGTVQDASGAVMPGSKVRVANPATAFRQEVETDASGSFVFPSLPVGTYDVLVERAGFKTTEQRGVVLDAASSRSLVFSLEVGQVTDSVFVSAAVEQVQTTSGNVGRVINEQQLSQIALNDYAQRIQSSARIKPAGSKRYSDAV
jgi:hypothetical protein